MPIPAIAQRSGRPPAPAAGDSAASPCPRRGMPAEHRWPLDGGDVIALTLDGIGMGRTARCGAGVPAGQLSRMRTSWRAAGRRAAGDSAARQPWRNLLAHCLAFVPDWQDYPQAATLRQRTGRCWRRPSSAGLTRRAPHPADGCLMPLPAPGLRAGESEL